jgi:hypothetical protein
MIIESISEPILAHASAQLMDHSNVLRNSVDQLIMALRMGMADAGYRGELLARLLLILAWDKTSKGAYDKASKINPSVSTKQRLSDFLRHLLASDAYMAFQKHLEGRKQEEILDFFVFCTHFVQIEKYTPNRNDLLEFFKRGAAVVCQRNQVGIDLMIPVYAYSGKDPKDAKLGEELQESRITFILVSVKNRIQSNLAQEWFTSMDPVSTEMLEPDADFSLPFVNIIMSLGGNINSFEVINQDRVQDFRAKNHAELKSGKGKTQKESSSSRSEDLESSKQAAGFAVDGFKKRGAEAVEHSSRKRTKVDEEVVDALEIWAKYSNTICLRGLGPNSYNSALFEEDLQSKLMTLAEAYLSPMHAAEYEEEKEDLETARGDIRAMLPLRYRAVPED